MLFGRDKSSMITAEDALPGRGETMHVPTQHHVNGAPLTPPFPEGTEQIILGMGCFWGVERTFWQLEGVVTTAAGSAGCSPPTPTYSAECSVSENRRGRHGGVSTCRSQR